MVANEAERLKALGQYRILDTKPEQAFDDLTLIASQICGVPIALCGAPCVLVACRKLPMRRSQEPGKSTLPPPRHRAHPSRLARRLTSTLRTSVTKNARTKEIFSIFPAILAK